MIAVVPLGGVPEELITDVAEALGSVLRLACRSEPARALAIEAWDAGREQWSSRILLRDLLVHRPRDARWVLGITGADLFLPVLTYVFGEAQVGGQAAVASFHRMREEHYLRPSDWALLSGRLRKTAIHEMGHALGLVHCSDRWCVMVQSLTIGDVDAKPELPCPRCRARIGI
jgi:archaemetzincin